MTDKAAQELLVTARELIGSALYSGPRGDLVLALWTAGAVAWLEKVNAKLASEP